MKNLLIIILCSIFLSAACEEFSAGKPGTPLAKVGTAELTLEEARNEIPAISYTADSISALKVYRDRWIEEQLILQEAERLRLYNNPAIREKIEAARRQVIINNFSELVLNSKNADTEVTTEDAQLYFQEHKNKFLLNERHVKYRHMVTDTYAKAEEARNELFKGTGWPAVLESYSLYPKVLLAESERFVPESNALKEYRVLNRYLHLIGLTEISPIEKIGNQFHFVQLVEEKAPGELPELSWLIPQIQNWLAIEKRRRAFNSYLKNLYLAGQANNEIIVYDNLPAPALTAETDTLNLN